MPSFAEFIAESFYSEVQLNWDLRGLSRVTAAFTVSSLKVQVTFELREPSRAWYVSSDVQRGEASERTQLAFHVFNGVFQAVREFIEIREPEMLVFATKREELAGIYQTYLRREQSTLHALGYELSAHQRVDPYVEFTLTRTRATKD